MLQKNKNPAEVKGPVVEELSSIENVTLDPENKNGKIVLKTQLSVNQDSQLPKLSEKERRFQTGGQE